jgi:hypothetical protein
MDSPILLSANFGYNLRIGHAPYSTGKYIVPQDLWDADPGVSTFHERERVFNDLGRDRALQYATSHKTREVRLSILKISWLWRADTDVLYWISSFGKTPLSPETWEHFRRLLEATYFAVLALALTSLIRIRSDFSSIVFAVLLIGAWTAAHVVFFGEPRYHLPVLAVILVPLAAATLERAAHYCIRAAGPRIRPGLDKTNNPA